MTDDLVEALARHEAVTSAHIGAAGDPSQSYLAYQRLALGTAEEDLLPLLSHPSSVVRTYIGQHVVAHMPAALESLLPLLRDLAAVSCVWGCTVAESRVADVIAGCLRYENHPEIHAFIRRALKQGDLDPDVQVELEAALKPPRDDFADTP